MLEEVQASFAKYYHLFAKRSQSVRPRRLGGGSQASGTTDEVVTVATVIPDNQVNTFYYPDNIGVTPGQLYFFEPVVLSAGSLDVGTKSPSSYLGGDLWSNGLMDPQADRWFREGIVVPEPSTVWLLAWGSGVFIWRWRVGRNSRL